MELSVSNFVAKKRIKLIFFHFLALELHIVLFWERKNYIFTSEFIIQAKNWHFHLIFFFIRISKFLMFEDVKLQDFKVVHLLIRYWKKYEFKIKMTYQNECKWLKLIVSRQEMVQFTKKDVKLLLLTNGLIEFISILNKSTLLQMLFLVVKCACKNITSLILSFGIHGRKKVNIFCY